MYIIDLFVNIFKGKKFASLAWIFINAVIIVFGVAVLLAMVTNGALEDWALFLIAFAVYIFSVALALSPVGEALMRWQNGCKKITDPAVLARIEPLFAQVFASAARRNPSMNQKIEIFICDEEEPNAFATGRKTVCITKGLLSLSDEEIKGIIAHEFGHLEHKDTDVLLIVTVGNLLVSMIIALVSLLVRIFNWIITFSCSLFMSERGGFIAGFLTGKINILLSFLFSGLAWLWTKLGVMLCIRSSRNQEYEADEYAYQIGFGRELMTSLQFFANHEPKKSKSLWAMLSATHPESSLRVERLNNLISGSFVKAPDYAAAEAPSGYVIIRYDAMTGKPVYAPVSEPVSNDISEKIYAVSEGSADNYSRKPAETVELPKEQIPLRYDPQTGKPVYPQLAVNDLEAEEEKTVIFRLNNGKTDTEPSTQLYAEKAGPEASAEPERRFDPMTGLPLNAQPVKKIIGYNPYTGAPVYESEPTSVPEPIPAPQAKPEIFSGFPHKKKSEDTVYDKEIVALTPVEAENYCNYQNVYRSAAPVNYEESGFAHGYPASSDSVNQSESVPMVFNRIYKSLIIPVGMMGALANLVLQASEILSAGIGAGNVIVVLLSFAGLILGGVSIYSLSKELAGAGSAAIAFAATSSVSAAAVTGLTAISLGNPTLAMLMLLASALVGTLYTALVGAYYSKRKYCFTR